MTISEYNTYFRQLALEHPRLQGHFMRGEVEEFFQNFRTRVQFPCLILEASEVSYPRTEAATMVRQRTGAFIVVQTYDVQKDYDGMHDALAECERIAEELIRRAATDASTGEEPFASLAGVSMVYMQNQPQKYVGARVEFTLAGAACRIEN